MPADVPGEFWGCFVLVLASMIFLIVDRYLESKVLRLERELQQARKEYERSRYESSLLYDSLGRIADGSYGAASVIASHDLAVVKDVCK